MRAVLVPSKLVIPLSRTSGGGSGRNYPEHYHLYEILCASLCIVIIPALFIPLSLREEARNADGIGRRQQEQLDTCTYIRDEKVDNLN